MFSYYNSLRLERLTPCLRKFWFCKLVHSIKSYTLFFTFCFNAAKRRYIESKLQALDQQSFTADSYPKVLDSAKEKRDVEKRFIFLLLHTRLILSNN